MEPLRKYNKRETEMPNESSSRMFDNDTVEQALDRLSRGGIQGSRPEPYTSEEINKLVYDALDNPTKENILKITNTEGLRDCVLREIIEGLESLLSSQR